VPSISNDSLVLTASQVPATPGFFMLGDLTGGGMDGMPFFNGLQCINNVFRIEKVFNGGSIPLQGSPPLSAFVGAMPGDTMFFQYWFRNGGGPCNTSVNTTNAVEVTWGL